MSIRWVPRRKADQRSEIHTKPWPLADAMFVEVEITHPRERQLHLLFQNGMRLAIGNLDQIPLAAELIVELRKIERRNPTRNGGRA